MVTMCGVWKQMVNTFTEMEYRDPGFKELGVWQASQLALMAAICSVPIQPTIYGTGALPFKGADILYDNVYTGRYTTVVRKEARS